MSEKNRDTGVSVPEKKDIFDGVLMHLAEMAYKVDGVERVTKSSKRARKKLKLDEINFNKELTDEQRVFVANRVSNRIKENVGKLLARFEWYRDTYGFIDCSGK